MRPSSDPKYGRRLSLAKSFGAEISLNELANIILKRRARPTLAD
jgi:hypothetical protein